MLGRSSCLNLLALHKTVRLEDFLGLKAQRRVTGVISGVAALRDMFICMRDMFIGCGGDGLTVGLGDFSTLFQPE